MTYITLPSDIVSASGTVAEEIVEYLRGEEWVGDDEVVDSLELQFKAGQKVVVTSLNTRTTGKVGE